MSAATLTRSSEPHGLDRVVLVAGLALVAWSRRRSARHSRLVVSTRRAPLTAVEREHRMFDPYAPEATHSHGLPPTLLR